MLSVPTVFPKERISFQGKGFMSKGKSGKGKSFSKSVQYRNLSCLAFPGVYLAEAARHSRVILDTGAFENAVGGKGKTSGRIKAQSELLLEAAANHLKTHGLDKLDPEKFQKAVLDYQMENAKVKKGEDRQACQAQCDPCGSARDSEYQIRRGGMDQHGEGQQVKGLWAALRHLQQKMKGKLAGISSHQISNHEAQRDGIAQRGLCAMDFESGKLGIMDQNGVPVEYSGCRTVCVGCHSPGVTGGASNENVEQQLPKPGPGGGKRKGVVPYVARKLASNMAILSGLFSISHVADHRLSGLCRGGLRSDICLVLTHGRSGFQHPTGELQ